MKKIIRIFLIAVLIVTVALATTSCEELMNSLFGGTDPTECPHVFENETIPPTCTMKGYDVLTCRECGAVKYVNYTNPTGHVESEWITDKEATETELGERHKECTECGKVLEREQVNPHSHDLVSVPALNPTCTTAGYDAYEYCTICGNSTFAEIPALGHEFSAWISLGNGTHTRTCANDDTHVEIQSCSGDTSDGGELPICEVCGTEYAFSARLGNSSYGYYALAEYQKGNEMQELYSAMRATCEEFLFSTEDLIKDQYGHCVIGKYNYKELSLTSDEAMGVWKLFYVDNPSYYWLSPVIATVGDELHLSVDGEYADHAAREEYDAMIAAKIEECNALISDDMSDLEVAMAIVTYIVGSMEYAYDENGQPEDDTWAHNLVGFASRGYGVCESYTKTFMHLCLLNGVECIMGSGYGGGEKHAWNYVFIEGAWYGADITWTDNSGDDVVFDTFGIAGDVFHTDHILHPSDSFGIDFIYEIPELSDESLELCELFEDGVSLGIYTSLENAFAAILDYTHEYVVKVGYYSFYVGAPEYTLDISALPRAEKITLVGVNQASEAGYLDKNSIVHISKDLTLNSTLELSNLELEGKGKVMLNKNELILSGDSVFLNTQVVGLTDGSVVRVLTDDTAYFFAGAQVHHLYADGRKIVFGADSHIVYIKGDEIYTSGDVELTIDNRIK